MKNLLFITIILLLFSCNNKYEFIDQEVIIGKITHIDYHDHTTKPTVYIQNYEQERKFKIPFEYKGTFKVGDSITLVVEKYEIIEDK